MAATKKKAQSVPFEQRLNTAAHYRKAAVIQDPREDDYTMRVPGLSKVRARQKDQNDQAGGDVIERVLTSGVVEALPLGIAAGVAGVFAVSQKNDINWAVGEAVVGFIVATGARNNSIVRDIALGTLAGGAVALVLRAVGRINLQSGQQ